MYIFQNENISVTKKMQYILKQIKSLSFIKLMPLEGGQDYDSSRNVYLNLWQPP